MRRHRRLRGSRAFDSVRESGIILASSQRQQEGTPMSIKISSQFDAGAIDVVNATSANAIDLNIRRDSHADITQWFHFRLQGARDQACTIRLLNAGQAAYADGWDGYHAMASYDRIDWFRVPTTYDGQALT